MTYFTARSNFVTLAFLKKKVEFSVIIAACDMKLIELRSFLDFGPRSLCLPPARVRRHIVFPLASVCLSVCVSVCLSGTKSCPLYNLITVTDISTKLHTFVKHIESKCHAQEP